MKYHLLALFLPLLVIPIIGIAENNEITPNASASLVDKKTTSADVLTRVNYFNETLTQVRLELGKPKALQSRIIATNVSPREVFFQTLAMFRKTDRLAFEWNKTKKNEPSIIAPQIIQPEHVLHNVNKAIERLLSVKKTLEIPEPIEQKNIHKNTQPNDVFKTILQINQQINTLLSKKIQPIDVYLQIDLTLNYTADLLTQFPEKIIIKKPQFIRKQSPENVYTLLFDSFKLIEKIFSISGQKIMNLTINDNQNSIITPSNVYDLSLILVSELTFIHSTHIHDHDHATLGKHFDRRILTADVFQHAEYLKRHLEALVIQTKKNPDWFGDITVIRKKMEIQHEL